jgi:hypothetical protein
MNIISHYPLLPVLFELLFKVILFSAGVVVLGSWLLAIAMKTVFAVY